MTRVLIDDHLPHRDVRARHRIRVAAPTEEAYLALGATDRDVGGLVRLLLPARALAGALMKGRAGVRSLAARVRTPITPRTVEARGFSRLAERRRLALVIGGVAFVAACETRPHSERSTSGPVDPPRPPAELSREQALDSARAFMARSNAAPEVFLDSTAIVAVDSLWRVTFRRRMQFVIPNVVTVDVDSRTGAMRFPGDE